MRRLAIALALAALLALVTGPAAGAGGTQQGPGVPHIKHVFIIVFENKNFADTFPAEDPPAPYLAERLVAQGELLTRYYGIAHDSLANYIAMVSGQGPNPQTQADCQFYTEFLPGIPTTNGQYLGTGCVFPNGVETVANQLEASGYEWKAYQQGMDQDNGRPGAPGPCRHPAINGDDHGEGAFTDGYVTKHNPFVYFHQIIDFETCAQHDVDLRNMSADLASRATTPNYAFITPTMCNDGHNEPCKNGKPGGYPQIDEFLKGKVRQIRRSPAYRDRGLLMILFDEAHSLDDCINSPCPTGSDPSACCGEVQGPNTPNNAGLEPGRGGGRIGAVLLSPCIRKGTVNNDPYNHYSMLRWVEDNFGLPHLGYAGMAGLRPFDANVFNRPGCGRD